MLPTKMLPTKRAHWNIAQSHANGLTHHPRTSYPGKFHISLFQAPVGKGSKTKSLRWFQSFNDYSKHVKLMVADYDEKDADNEEGEADDENTCFDNFSFG